MDFAQLRKLVADIFECDPAAITPDASPRHKVAASHLETIVAQVLAALGAQESGKPILMANVRDGFLPARTPSHLYSGCLAFKDSEDDLKVGCMVLDFFGRSDVGLERGADFEPAAAGPFARAVPLLHPDTLEADEERCNLLLRLDPKVQLVVGAPRPDRAGELRVGQRHLLGRHISNRHIPEDWQDYSVLVSRPR